MKYCEYCGARLEDDVSFCPNCGARVEKREEAARGESIDFAFTGGSAYNRPVVDTKPRPIIAILSFIFPLLVGLVVWLTSKDTCPGKANSALKGALAKISWLFPIVGFVLYFVWKNEKPDFAKVGLIFAIIGFVFGFIGYIFGCTYGITSDIYGDTVTVSALRMFIGC